MYWVHFRNLNGSRWFATAAQRAEVKLTSDKMTCKRREGSLLLSNRFQLFRYFRMPKWMQRIGIGLWIFCRRLSVRWNRNDSFLCGLFDYGRDKNNYQPHIDCLFSMGNVNKKSIIHSRRTVVRSTHLRTHSEWCVIHLRRCLWHTSESARILCIWKVSKRCEVNRNNSKRRL